MTKVFTMRFFIFALICCSNLFFSQETKILGNISFKPSPYIAQNFDVSQFNVTYEITYTSKPELKQNSKKSFCILQIGEKYSKFCDLNTLRKDSLQYNFTKKQSVGTAEINALLKYKPFYSTILLKSSENQLVYQNNVMAHVYQYEEEKPALKWKLINESKKILNYDCKKATVHYRGRDFIAWYATEIPLNNGPYIFEGLPGLILEVFDSNNKFHFSAMGIDKKKSDIYMRNENTIINTKREKFREVQKNYYENPGAFVHAKAFNADGSPMVIKSKPLLYDPFELE